MAKNYFNIAFSKLAILLLPTFLRMPLVKAWASLAAYPFGRIYDIFSNNRSDNLYNLSITGQVCRLRKMLNDAFPLAGGRITIEDGSASGEWQYAWGENYDPYRKYLLVDGNTLLWGKSVIQAGVSGFVVKVPTVLNNQNNDARMRSLLNKCKLVSKSYTIIYE